MAAGRRDLQRALGAFLPFHIRKSGAARASAASFGVGGVSTEVPFKHL